MLFIIVAALAAFILGWFFVDFIPEYIAERDYIKYLKVRKEWLANEHPCKYYKENLFIKCHDKEGKEECIHCPYIPFEEECKYYNL